MNFHNLLYGQLFNIANIYQEFCNLLVLNLAMEV